MEEIEEGVETGTDPVLDAPPVPEAPPSAADAASSEFADLPEVEVPVEEAADVGSQFELFGEGGFHLATLTDFLSRGGPVLYVIMAATFIMWTLMLERFFYFRFSHSGVVKDAVSRWEERDDHTSEFAHWVREKLISEVRQKAQQNVILVKATVAIAPLLGLLGTVTGMVNVFDLMAITGSSNARVMSAGVSMATIPTMAGMVASISGLLFTLDLDRKVRREVQAAADQMEIHHA